MLFATSALAALVALLPAALADAVPASNGRVLPDDGDYVTIKLAKKNNQELLFAGTVDGYQRPGPYKFGSPVDMSLDVTQIGSQRIVDSEAADRTGKYSVRRMAIESADAFSLNVNFAKFFLPEGAEMYLIGEKDTEGPYTQKDNQLNGKFGTWPMEGSRLLIEVWTPVASAEQPQLVIESVVHGFRSIDSSGSCNIDVACTDSAGWEKEIRSVAIILADRGSGFCSGSMINNARNDGRQLFLTANHCVSGPWDNNVLMFNYQRPACNSRTGGPKTDQVRGLSLLSRFYTSDFALFEVQQPIPDSYNVHLAGFYAGKDDQPSAVGIHHPSADVKKFSERQGALTKDCWASDNCRNGDHWKVPRWTKGTTEPGSSGSPLFNGDHLIIGQLHGGRASCYNVNGYDVYGAMFASWTGGQTATSNLKQYLDPEDTGALTVPGVDLSTARNTETPSPLVIQALEK